MKFFGILLVLLCLVIVIPRISPAGATAIAAIAGPTCGENDPAGTTTSTGGYSSSSGDVIVVVAGTMHGPITFTSSMVTDNIGNTYSLATSNNDVGIWTATAKSSGTDTITFTNNGSSTYYGICAEEYSGSSVGTNVNTSSGTGTSLTVSVSGAASTSWVVGGFVSWRTASISMSSPDVQRQNDVNPNLNVDEGDVPASGSTTLTGTLSASTSWYGAAFELTRKNSSAFNCTDWTCSNYVSPSTLSVASNGTAEIRQSNPNVCDYKNSFYDSLIRGTPPSQQGGPQGTPLPSGITSVSVSVKFLGRTLGANCSGPSGPGPSYNLFMSLYFRLATSQSTCGVYNGISWLDTQVRVEDIQGTDSPVVTTHTYGGSSDTSVGACGFSRAVAKLNVGSIGTLVGDVNTQCLQAEIAWGITPVGALTPSDACTLTGVEIGTEGFDFSALNTNWYNPTLTTAISGAHFDHVVFIAMENRNYSSIFGNCPNGPDPFLCSMLPYSTTIPNYQAYGADDFTGDEIGRNGLGNCSAACYVALTSGASYWISDGYCNSLTGCPSANTWTVPNLISVLNAAGLTWQVFCETGTHGCNYRYADHFPFLAYANTYNNPNTFNGVGSTVSTSTFIAAANSANPPNFLWYTPTDDNNMHNNDIASGDNYLKNFLVGSSGSITSPASGSLLSSNLFTNPAYHTLLWVWWDEGSGPYPETKIAANIEYGSAVKVGYTSTATTDDEYSILQTLENNWQLGSLAYEMQAPLMTEIFRA